MTDHDGTPHEPGDGDQYAARDTEHDIRAAFASLRNDTREVDTMAALRQLEGRRRWVVPVALGGAVAAVLLLLGLVVLGGDEDPDENVATIDDGGAADAQAPAEGDDDGGTDDDADAQAPAEGHGDGDGAGDEAGESDGNAEDEVVEGDGEGGAGSDEGAGDEGGSEIEGGDDDEPGAEQEEVAVLLEGEGLGFVGVDSGSISRLSFGSPAGQVLDALDRVLGEGERSPSNPECPNQADRTAVWPAAGLQVELRGGELIAWSLRPGSELTTLTGIGIGSTRAEIEEAYVIELVDSTLGVEFVTGDDAGAADAIRGLLSGRGNRATITDFWAGEICAFR